MSALIITMPCTRIEPMPAEQRVAWEAQQRREAEAQALRFRGLPNLVVDNGKQAQVRQSRRRMLSMLAGRACHPGK